MTPLRTPQCSVLYWQWTIHGPATAALAQAAAAALLLAAALGAVAGNREAGQSPERCYSGPIPAGQASFGYTVSASPNATTFTFAVRGPRARGLPRGGCGSGVTCHVQAGCGASCQVTLISISASHKVHQHPAHRLLTAQTHVSDCKRCGS